MLEEGSILSSYHGSHATIPSREPTHADEPSEPFPDLHALTQAHSRYHSCTDNTHSGWARPRYMRPHTERSSPFQALPLLVCALKYPGPRKYLFLVATPRPTTYVPRPDGQVRRPYGGPYKPTHLLVRRMDFGKSSTHEHSQGELPTPRLSVSAPVTRPGRGMRPASNTPPR